MRRHEYFRVTSFFARWFDRRSGKFIVNIAYKTRTDIADWSVEVAEDFVSVKMSFMCM